MSESDSSMAENRRLAALRATQLLDTPNEARFDRWVQLARKTFDVPIALVSFVDADRQWFKANSGLNEQETPRSLSFCSHAIQQRGIMVVEDATQDDRFKDNRLVLDEPGIRFYAGAPLQTPNGEQVGTLCIIDTKVRQLTESQLTMLRSLGDAVQAEMNLHAYQSAAEDLIQQQSETSETNQRLLEREQRLSSIYDLAPVGISICDSDGQLIEANHAAEAILNQSMEALTHRQIDDPDWRIFDERGFILDPQDFASSRALRERRPVTNQIMKLEQGAYSVWLSVSASPLPDGGAIIVYSDISDLKQQQDRIGYLAAHDQLTGLCNRSEFMHELDGRIAVARNTDQTLSVITFDINHFKEINESAGHTIGDQLLLEVAKRLQRHVRSRDLIARIGGDEFAIITFHHEAEIEALIERLLAQLSQAYEIQSAEFRINISAGVATLPRHSDSADVLLRRADMAMFHAKTMDLPYCRYHDALNNFYLRRIALVEGLEYAIRTSALRPYLQPQLNIETGELVGAEVLLRWQDPDFGWVSPAEFIPLAEERGLICRITQYVIRNVLQQLQTWREEGLEMRGRVGINISIRDLEQPQFVEELLEQVATSGCHPKQLELEITETAFMRDPEVALATLTKLHEAGFSLAIDDFGIGHSVLNYLKQIQADVLKIDISFTRELLTSAADKAIIQTIIATANIFGMKTLAEGVESAEQAQELRRLGCDYAQGYWYGEPQPIADFETNWLRDGRAAGRETSNS